jgi:hypothetical protein
MGYRDFTSGPKRATEKSIVRRGLIIKELHMGQADSVVAVFADHLAAEAAVKKLAAGGFDMKNLSVVGKGYHTEEKVVGFYSNGDRITFWGARGAFWGGLWGLFFGGLFLTVPVLGHVIVLGYLAATLVAGIESAVLVGGMSAVGAALYGLGVPKDSVLQYEAAVKADRFLVMAHGSPRELASAKAILATFGPSSLEIHSPEKAVTFPVGSPEDLAEAGIFLVHE